MGFWRAFKREGDAFVGRLATLGFIVFALCGVYAFGSWVLSTDIHEKAWIAGKLVVCLLAGAGILAACMALVWLVSPTIAKRLLSARNASRDDPLTVWQALATFLIGTFAIAIILFQYLSSHHPP